MYQTAVEKALTSQPWVGVVEHADDTDGSRAEQWQAVDFHVREWSFDQGSDDYVAALTARGRCVCMLACVSECRRDGKALLVWGCARQCASLVIVDCPMWILCFIDGRTCTCLCGWQAMPIRKHRSSSTAPRCNGHGHHNDRPQVDWAAVPSDASADHPTFVWRHRRHRRRLSASKFVVEKKWSCLFSLLPLLSNGVWRCCVRVGVVSACNRIVHQTFNGWMRARVMCACLRVNSFT